MSEAPTLSTRERMLLSAVLLVRERGARATSIDDVLRHSGAPRGSVYHHFPGGRQQLLQEATHYAGDLIAGRLQRLGGLHPVAALDRFIAGYRDQLERFDHRPGCPVAAVALEAPDDGETGVLDEARDVFARWLDLLAAAYAAHGASEARARELATTVLAGLEGALVLCQAARDTAPLDVIHHQLRTLLLAELDPPEDPT